jgi:hypothetical protein
MAKLQSFKRLIIEDFPEKDRNLVAKLAYPINSTFEDILNVLNKNLTIEDNLTINKKDFTVTVDANGVPIVNTVILSGLNSSCVGMQVIKAINSTNPTISPTGTPFITFSDNSGQITISKITNLQANNKYTLRVILYT